MKLHDYSGIIHFHSSFSFDGHSSVPEILTAADKNDLDFLMLTDHFNLKAREAGFEGWHGDTLLIVGEEISQGQFNHYLAFDVREPVNAERRALSPQAVIDRVLEQGGFGFIAHPDHEGTRMFHVKPFPWIEWGVTGYTGIGIWDFMTDWQSSLNGYLRSLLSYTFPALFLRGPRRVTLRRWDELNRTSKVIGIGELDNHNTMKKLFFIPIPIFPFQRAFRFIRTHLLTERTLEKNPAADIETLFDALKRGRVYVAQEYFHPSKGFSFVIEDGGREATMGDEFLLDEKAMLKVRLPWVGKIRIIRDGDLFRETIAEELNCPIDQAGVYRAEGYLKAFGRYRPWIFSNPIRVCR